MLTRTRRGRDSRRSALMGLSRSGFQSEPTGPNAEDLALIRLLDSNVRGPPILGGPSDEGYSQVFTEREEENDR